MVVLEGHNLIIGGNEFRATNARTTVRLIGRDNRLVGNDIHDVASPF
ncbi:MAG: hypothetical protein MJE77_09895 [Proteobacteria bacterium]|nr:hypothetical protein [Pseudomonadota bacterium]